MLKSGADRKDKWKNLNWKISWHRSFKGSSLPGPDLDGIEALKIQAVLCS